MALTLFRFSFLNLYLSLFNFHLSTVITLFPIRKKKTLFSQHSTFRFLGTEISVPIGVSSGRLPFLQSFRTRWSLVDFILQDRLFWFRAFFSFCPKPSHSFLTPFLSVLARMHVVSQRVPCRKLRYVGHRHLMQVRQASCGARTEIKVVHCNSGRWKKDYKAVPATTVCWWVLDPRKPS